MQTPVVSIAATLVSRITDISAAALEQAAQQVSSPALRWVVVRPPYLPLFCQRLELMLRTKRLADSGVPDQVKEAAVMRVLAGMASIVVDAIRHPRVDHPAQPALRQAMGVCLCLFAAVAGPLADVLGPAQESFSDEELERTYRRIHAALLPPQLVVDPFAAVALVRTDPDAFNRWDIAESILSGASFIRLVLEAHPQLVARMLATPVVWDDVMHDAALAWTVAVCDPSLVDDPRVRTGLARHAAIAAQALVRWPALRTDSALLEAIAADDAVLHDVLRRFPDLATYQCIIDAIANWVCRDRTGVQTLLRDVPQLAAIPAIRALVERTKRWG